MRFDSRTITILGALTAYAIFLFFNYEEIAQFMASSDTLTALLTYLIFNPAYLFIIYSIWKRFANRRAWKRAIASILLIFSLDFLAIPRLLKTDPLTNGAVITTNIGSVIMRALETSVSHEVAYVMMYLVLPILGLVISIELLGITNFIREIR